MKLDLHPKTATTLSKIGSNAILFALVLGLSAATDGMFSFVMPFVLALAIRSTPNQYFGYGWATVVAYAIFANQGFGWLQQMATFVVLCTILPLLISGYSRYMIPSYEKRVLVSSIWGCVMSPVLFHLLSNTGIYVTYDAVWYPHDMIMQAGGWQAWLALQMNALPLLIKDILENFIAVPLLVVSANIFQKAIHSVLTESHETEQEIQPAMKRFFEYPNG